MYKYFQYFLVSAFLFVNQFAYSQCKVLLKDDSLTMVCGGTVQLTAMPDWITLNSGVTNIDLHSVFFINKDTGWVVGGNGTILKTINAGTNWVKQTSGTTTTLTKVIFTNDTTGFIINGVGILKTTNGGATWANIIMGFPLPGAINALQFINAQKAYFACSSINGDDVYTTNNGGATWTKVGLIEGNHTNGMHFTNKDTGFAIDYKMIYRTTDGGVTWDTCFYDPNGMILLSLFFRNNELGWASYESPNLTQHYLMRTTDGGKNWTTRQTDELFRSYSFLNDSVGYAAGGGNSIYKTTNGGKDWITLRTIKYSGLLFSICFTDSMNGFAAGSSGKIMKYSLPDSFSWSPSFGLNNHKLLNPVSNTTATTSYIITTYTKGCVAKDTVKVKVEPIKLLVESFNLFCGDSVVLTPGTNYTGQGTLTYNWQPTTGLSDPNSPNPTAKVTRNIKYKVTVNSSEGCTATDSVFLSFFPPRIPEICIVGVDENNKNIIVWTKDTALKNIDTFYVHKEAFTNNYIRIGAVSANDIGVFVDTTSKPAVQSNKYLLSVKDLCNNESGMGSPHKTMHLSINQGVPGVWNLIWESYQGFQVNGYNIFRGTNKNNLQLIGSSSGSNTQYSDLNPPAGIVYYQIEIISPNQCNPGLVYQTSRSNIASTNPVGIKASKPLSDNFFFTPNPGKNEITIHSNEIEISQTILKIFDNKGVVVQMENLYQNGQRINISKLSNGIYYLQIGSNNLLENHKLIIQR